jgi:uncharacterized protein YciI
LANPDFRPEEIVSDHRIAHRPTHREHLQGLVASGQMLMAGPFDDQSGGIQILEAGIFAEVEGLMERDPFTTEGVFATTEIRPWTVVAGS